MAQDDDHNSEHGSDTEMNAQPPIDATAVDVVEDEAVEDAPKEKEPMSTCCKVAIGFGVGIGVIVLAIVIFILVTMGTKCEANDANIHIRVSGSDRLVTTNGCPTHAWDAVNPNDAEHQEYFDSEGTFTLPATPYLATWANKLDVECVGGPVGVARTGAVIFSPFPGTCGGDAVQLEGDTFDACGGHADPNGRYHYHLYAKCLGTADGTNTTIHSNISGYMADGIPIYGPRGDNGTIPTDLDACGGHASDGGNNGMYHYHYRPINNVSMPDAATPLSNPGAAIGYPYTVACLRGCIHDGLRTSLEAADASIPYSSFAECASTGTVMTGTEDLTVTP
jgi:hypothetical protein